VFEYFHLYIKVDCGFCKDAIDLLERENKEFVITVLDKCSSFEEGIKRELGFRTVPIILKCTVPGTPALIGGYTELKAALLKGDKK
tara:strand:+ start:2328 stop:2585 length:258 start_codon:yes stop_codon:yes gene_type:complete